MERTFFASLITWMSKTLCKNFIKTDFSEDDFPQNSDATPPAPALSSHVVNEAKERERDRERVSERVRGVQGRYKRGRVKGR